MGYKQYMKLLLGAIITLLVVSFNCTKEKVIIYKPLTGQVNLVYPPDGDLEFVTLPELRWKSLGEAARYQVQVASNDAFRSAAIDTIIADTSFTASPELDNGTYYWRVRAENTEQIWGDWSDAEIRAFELNNSAEFFELVAIVETPGTPQDVFICDDIAYVADGQRMLMLVDITDPANPSEIGRLEDIEQDDFARGIWKYPGDDIAYVADTDGKVVALDTSLPLNPYSDKNISFGFSQNIYDITGINYDDTIYVFFVGVGFRHRNLFFSKIPYENGVPIPNEYNVGLPLPADGKGVCVDSMNVVVEYYHLDTLTSEDSIYYDNQMGRFIFVAASEGGLGWVNISTSHTFDGTDSLVLMDPVLLGWSETPSWAEKVCARNGYVYVADDRGGVQVFELPDTIPSFDHDDYYEVEPILIGNLNTSGRTKDVHLAGNYCFIADGAGGLKAIDISVPSAPVYIARYDTEYAYGLWADENYIYLCDRDFGLMIFRNLL